MELAKKNYSQKHFFAIEVFFAHEILNFCCLLGASSQWINNPVSRFTLQNAHSQNQAYKSYKLLTICGMNQQATGKRQSSSIGTVKDGMDPTPSRLGEVPGDAGPQMPRRRAVQRYPPWFNVSNFLRFTQTRTRCLQKKLYFYTLTASKHQKQSKARIDKSQPLTFRSAAVYEQSTKQKWMVLLTNY